MAAPDETVDAGSRTALPPDPDRPPRILVFDSGIGGLSVAREIRAARPGASSAIGVARMRSGPNSLSSGITASVDM